MQQQQEPSQNDLAAVIDLLHNNGVAITNARAAYEALEQHRTNPVFCVALSRLFGSPQAPAPVPAGAAGWAVYRQLAGVTLKNSIDQRLGPAAIATAAQISLEVLRTGDSPVLVRTAAQIITKITAIAGLAFWDSVGGAPGYLASLLIGAGSLMLSASPMQILGALYCVQFLLEDVPKQIGESSAVIVERVVNAVVVAHSDATVRKVAFRVANHPYEIGAALDWNVEALSPLQIGLCQASVHLARATQFVVGNGDAQRDPVVMTLALRSAHTLIDYLDYFPAQMGPGEFSQMSSRWIAMAVACVQRQQSDDRESAAAAADFLAYVADAYDRAGGEGVIGELATLLQQALPVLLPALVEHAVMADEEIESILATDHYSRRDASAVQVCGGQNIEEDPSMGEDEAAVTVRRSAGSCIAACCRLAPQEAFPVVLGAASAGWAHADWRRREVGLMVFGAAYDGCGALMAETLTAITPQLAQLASKPDEHTCVVSMALWVMGKSGSWLMTAADGGLVATVVQCCCARLPSESKRIQLSAATALNAIYTAGHASQSAARLQPSLSAVVQAVHTCLPVYHTLALQQLCMLALNVMPTLSEAAHVAALVAPFQSDREARMARFASTYTACYVNGDAAVLVDKDVFQCDHVLVAGLMRCPSPGAVVPPLQTWAAVLADIATRKVFDDADMLYYAMFSVISYLKACDTASLVQWLRGTAATATTLAGSICGIVQDCAHALVRSAGLLLLFNLVTLAGSDGLPEALLLPCLQMVAGFALGTDTAQEYSEAARVVVAIYTTFPAQASNTGVSFQQVAQKLRGDAFGDSLSSYTSTAVQLCQAMHQTPAIVTLVPLAVVCEILRQAPNDAAKASATVGLAHGVQGAAAANQLAAVLSPPGVVQNLLRCSFSWQQGAAAFPGCFEALAAMLHSVKAVAVQAMGAALQGLHADYRKQFIETYQLQ